MRTNRLLILTLFVLSCAFVTGCGGKELGTDKASLHGDCDPIAKSASALPRPQIDRARDGCSRGSSSSFARANYF
jgi:hypothetical protein